MTEKGESGTPRPFLESRFRQPSSRFAQVYSLTSSRVLSEWQTKAKSEKVATGVIMQRSTSGRRAGEGEVVNRAGRERWRQGGMVSSNRENAAKHP